MKSTNEMRKQNMKHQSLRLESLETRQLLTANIGMDITDCAEHFAEYVQDWAENLGDGAETWADNIADNAENFGDNIADKAENWTDNIANKAENWAGNLVESFKNYIQNNGVTDATKPGIDDEMMVGQKVDAKADGSRISVSVNDLDSGDYYDWCTTFYGKYNAETGTWEDFNSTSSNILHFMNVRDGSYTTSFKAEAGEVYMVFSMITDSHMSSKDADAICAEFEKDINAAAEKYLDKIYGHSADIVAVHDLELNEVPNSATESSVSFSLDGISGAPLSAVTVEAKFNDAKQSTIYTVEELFKDVYTETTVEDAANLPSGTKQYVSLDGENFVWMETAEERDAFLAENANAKLYYISGQESLGLWLVNEAGEACYEIAVDGFVVTVKGLQAKKDQDVRITISAAEDTAATTSNWCRMETTGVQKATATEVKAELVDGAQSDSVLVTWVGEEGDTYTIKYTDANGKEKTATCKATTKKVVKYTHADKELADNYVAFDADGNIVNTAEQVAVTYKLMSEVKAELAEKNEVLPEGTYQYIKTTTYEGSFVVDNLKADTKYTFSVINNGDRDFDDSVAVKSNEVTTWAELRTPIAIKGTTTDTSATLKVLNWEKLDLEKLEGAKVLVSYVVDGTTELAGAVTFVYVNGEWTSTNKGVNAKLNVLRNGNAEIVIGGLTADTKYDFSIATVADKAISGKVEEVNNVKTRKDANDKPTWLENLGNFLTKGEESNSITVNWEGLAGKNYTISYTDIEGITRIATAFAKTDAENIGKYVINNLKPNMEYIISIFTNEDKDGSISDKITDILTTKSELKTPMAMKDATTADSATLKVYNWDKMDLEAKDAKLLVSWAVDGANELTGAATFEYNEESKTWTTKDKSANIATLKVVNGKAYITVNGLMANTKYDFTIQAVDGDATSKVEKVNNVKTEKTSNAKPTDVEVELSLEEPSSTAIVTWNGEVGQKYTITYTDAQGNTRTATKYAKTDANGVGRYELDDLKDGATYTIQIQASKDSDGSASDFVEAGEVTTLAALKKAIVCRTTSTKDSASFIIANWGNMDLQDKNAELIVKYGENFVTFTYDAKAGWTSDVEGCTLNAKKSIATVVIGGLEANTKYTVEFASIVRDNGAVIAASDIQEVSTRTSGSYSWKWWN
ncbi:MAG: fibronectin type III domain-containing protein [Planctomycetia bacterium]|nr:fibronectin type III domain-containing protein [Planctomycetia bacterium]